MTNDENGLPEVPIDLTSPEYEALYNLAKCAHRATYLLTSRGPYPLRSSAEIRDIASDGMIDSFVSSYREVEGALRALQQMVGGLQYDYYELGPDATRFANKLLEMSLDPEDMLQVCADILMAHANMRRSTL